MKKRSIDRKGGSLPLSQKVGPASPSHGTILILLAIVTVLAYWPICTAEFTSWDDFEAIAKNPTMLPPTLHSLKVWWTQPTADLWIPITYTTWGAIAAIAQVPGDSGPTLTPSIFHAANLLLHVLAVLVVFELLEFLIRKRWPAAAGAALFALHPVQVEPVAWAAGMKDVLYGLLALVAIWQYLLGVDAKGHGRKGRWHFAVATAVFALALLSKPTAIVVPIIAAVLVRAYPPRRTSASRASTWIILIWLAMAIPIMTVAHHFQPVPRAIEIVPLWQRPIVALDAIAFYIGKILWPIGLCIDYGRVPWRIFDTGQAYWTWIVPVAIAGLLLTWGRTSASSVEPRQRMLLAGAAVFVVGLLPVLGFVGFDFQGISTVADHYLYVPMFGVALIAAWLLALPAVNRHRPWAIGGAAVVLALLALRSFTLTWSWQDSDTLFHHVLAVNPGSSPANETLSDMALDAGDPRQAIAYAKASISGNPRRPHGWVKLANAYTAAGDKQNAIDAMRQACRMDPDEAQVHLGLGVKLVDVGQPVPAAEEFREALRLDPNSFEGQLDLSVDLFQMGQPDEAFAHIQRAAQIDPDNAAAPLTRGDFLRELGRWSEARAEYEKALRLRPGLKLATDRLAQLAAAATTRNAR
jgi:Flp pilus assembly protein TadD